MDGSAGVEQGGVAGTAGAGEGGRMSAAVALCGWRTVRGPWHCLSMFRPASVTNK